MKIVLASQSPRRRQLLGEMGVAFTAMDAPVEESVPEGTHPRVAVELLARRKCLYGAACSDREALVIGSDTLVEMDGAALGKPLNEEEALQMLMALSGRVHRVHTGVAVAYRGEVFSDVCTTEVTFRAFDQREAAAYVATGEPMDKAGAYGIQGLGGKLVDHIEGSLDNVIGFPTQLVRRLMTAAGKGEA